MESKPDGIVVGHAQEGQEGSARDGLDLLSMLSGLRTKAAGVALGVLFLYGLYIVHTFVNEAFNRGYEEYYSIAVNVDETPSNPQIVLEYHQHDSATIDGVAYDIFEIRIEEDDYFSGTLFQALTEPYDKDDFDLQLGSTAIAKADDFSFNIAFATADGRESASFSCSNLADCDEDGDGWLHDHNGRGNVYFCNCGTHYEDSMMVALRDADGVISMSVSLDYYRDEALAGLMFEVIFMLGSIASVVVGRQLEHRHFTRTVLVVTVPLLLMNTLFIFDAF